MPARRKRRRSVALLIETSNRYSRELLHGIHDWIHSHDDWALHLTEHGRGDVPPPWLKNWKGDGIIARIENKQIERAVINAGVPTVNVSATGLGSQFPTVISDSAAVAYEAAEHLISRGFNHFAYFGDARFPWSQQHGENFQASLGKQGHSCHIFPSAKKDSSDWTREQNKIANWLKKLPRPIGIMACYDIRGQQLLDVCRDQGISIPDDVAVIGQHNDELLCELCDPPLSSVIPDPRHAGRTAAELLNHLMKGRKVRKQLHPIAPIGVATRRSTDVISIPDAALSEAIRFIRDHALEGINVEDVLKAVPMSRTLLERRFKTYLKRSPYDEIIRIRLRKTQQLLKGTDLPIAEIASRTGFTTPEYLSAAFKKKTGVSPRGFRTG